MLPLTLGHPEPHDSLSGPDDNTFLSHIRKSARNNTGPVHLVITPGSRLAWFSNEARLCDHDLPSAGPVFAQLSQL